MTHTKKTKQILLVMFLYSIALIFTALLLDDISDTLKGLLIIINHPSQLTIDYFNLASPAATFLNASLVGLGVCLVFYISLFELNAASLMAYFLTVGFSFFGINIMNMWPCILGTYLYSILKKLSFASNVNIAIFATSLAPFVSEMIVRYPLFDNLAYSIILKVLSGIMIGIIAGFLMPPLFMHSPNIHKGYTLYSAAAIAGFIGILLYAFLYGARGISAPTNTSIGESHKYISNIFAITTSIIMLIVGCYYNHWSFKGIKDLFKNQGYRTDFIKQYGLSKTLINLGLFGLFTIAYYNMINASFTGPTMGSIICLLAIAPCGAHIFNMWPIMLGYIIAASISTFNINTQAIVVGLSFAGALVPIVGCYGSLCGIIAGIIHASIVTTVVTFHGGFCLYNGGFTSAIVAIILVPVLESFFIHNDEIKLLPSIKK